MSDQIRILRVIEYSGPREAVEEQVSKSIHGVRICNGVAIKVATLDTFPEVIDSVPLANGEAERLRRHIEFLETENSGLKRELAEQVKGG